jgi:hypothetical protein
MTQKIQWDFQWFDQAHNGDNVPPTVIRGYVPNVGDLIFWVQNKSFIIKRIDHVIYEGDEKEGKNYDSKVMLMIDPQVL